MYLKSYLKVATLIIILLPSLSFSTILAPQARLIRIIDSLTLYKSISNKPNTKAELQKMMQSAESVTYLVTGKNNYKSIASSFDSFAKAIGDTHLAVHLDLSHTNETETLNQSFGANISNRKNLATAFDVMSYSDCDFTPYFEDFIVYDNKKDNICFIFALDSEGWVLNTLKTIANNLNQNDKLRAYQINNNLIHGVDVNNLNEVAKSNRWVLREFLDYLGEKLFSN